MKYNCSFKDKLSIFEEKINFKFNNIDILINALTHSSYANEHKGKYYEHNERLEFLGDSVLNIIVSDYIYKKYPYYPEGELTKLRAAIVCESSLAFISRQINLGEYLILGKGEETTGGRERDSVLADAFEALLGGIYLDGGLEKAKEFFINIFKKNVVFLEEEKDLFFDYKTKFQEIFQKKFGSKIEYTIEKEEGPDHDKVFYVDVVVDNKILGRGLGKNKKEAEQMAAKEALNGMGVKNE